MTQEKTDAMTFMEAQAYFFERDKNSAFSWRGDMFKTLPSGETERIYDESPVKVTAMRGTDPVPASFVVDWANEKIDQAEATRAAPTQP